MTIRKRIAVLGALAWTSLLAQVATPWEEYLRKPTPENAAMVSATAYSDATESHERLEEDLMLLEVQVLSRDAEAVRLAFRLRATADGHVRETIDIMLGRLIRIDPELFLRELKRAGAAAKRLDSLVGNVGPGYVDRTEARAYEREQRILALGRVSIRELRELRDQCIRMLGK